MLFSFIKSTLLKHFLVKEVSGNRCPVHLQLLRFLRDVAGSVGSEYFDTVAAQVFVDLRGGVKPFVTDGAGLGEAFFNQCAVELVMTTFISCTL
jgi:hypothetical protein